MKLKILLQAALLLVVSVCAVQAATIVDVRRNPFHRPALTSVADFKQMVEEEQAAIRDGMTQAGYPELFQPLMSQISSARVKRVSYAPGQQFIWMLSRSERTGRLIVLNPMIWGGATMLPAYEFSILKGGTRYVFSVPIACGNLGLKDVIVEQGPTPAQDCDEPDCGKTGQDCPPCQDCKQPDCPPCCGSSLRFVADVGFLHQVDPANYLFARVGVQHAVSERLSLLAMVGGAAQVDGDDGDDAFLIDFLLQYDWFRVMLGHNQWLPVFIGGGLGGWITSGDKDTDGGDTDLDLIANIGARLTGHPHSFGTSLFFEARTGADELDSINEYGRFGAGLRCSF